MTTRCWACGHLRFSPGDQVDKKGGAHFCQCHNNAALVTLQREIEALPIVGRAGDHNVIRRDDVLKLITSRIVKYD